ncbi:MAG: T9SS type A sorting domain-containing protein [Flavobacteriia bacterium]|nr:T9SS type A sorting domain-containing protein [Flavobacteriia bacterium]
MRKIITFLFGIVSTIAFSQNTILITPQNYDILKQNGQLDAQAKYVFPNSNTPNQIIHPSFEQIQASKNRSSVCNCLLDLDSSFSVVPFIGDSLPDYRNDDGSTDLINLPFVFDFYGVQYQSVYINNNGNVSFAGPYMTYTALPFPDASYNMIAPFWGDVDTRDSLSGLVYYKITPSALIIKWENVGYFNVHSDLSNTFQLIITNGNDSLVPNGNNVSFCYGDMNWTTGDASNGVGGFGGSPATVGVNQGDGVNYFQVGTFDALGTAFDGPYNNADQIDFLDNQEIYFNLANLGNVPPLIMNEFICDTIDVYTGDTLKKSLYIDEITFTIGVTTPELNQNVTAVLTSSEPNHFSYVLTKDTPTFKEYECTFDMTGLLTDENSQLFYIDINATDDGMPAASSSQTIVVRGNYSNQSSTGIVSIADDEMFNVAPNPTDNQLIVEHKFNNGENPILRIIDLSGKEVKTEILTTASQNVNVSNLESGIYLVSIQTNNGITRNVKVIKK